MIVRKAPIPVSGLNLFPHIQGLYRDESVTDVLTLASVSKEHYEDALVE